MYVEVLTCSMSSENPIQRRQLFHRDIVTGEHTRRVVLYLVTWKIKKCSIKQVQKYQKL